MRAAGEHPQHARSIGGVLGFREDVAVEGDGGVGAENDHMRWGGTVGRHLRKDRQRFFPRQADDIGDRILTGRGSSFTCAGCTSNAYPPA